MHARRTYQIDVIDEDSKTITIEGRLQDPFHDIRTRLVLEKDGLSIVSAIGNMDRVPYPAGCPRSLPRLDGIRGIEVRSGFGRRVREALGGDQGCPYLVELSEQICKFALVMIKADEARRVTAAGDNERFMVLRGQMGECAGHTFARVDELPDWLEREIKDGSRDR